MMAWCRLWNDMPTDPKWRVISNRSGESISSVIAVFTFLMVAASSNANERGRTQGFDPEDVAASLDMKVEQVKAIVSAMEGKVLRDGILLGWEKRQPKREDGSAERAKEWRERKRTQPNAEERPDQIRSEQNRTDQNAVPANDLKIEKKSFVFTPTEETHKQTLTLAPGWDRQALYSKFGEWIRTDAKELPSDPQKAFLGWVPKFTSDKKRNQYQQVSYA